MKTIKAQFNKLSGPDATASYKLEFIIDEAQRSCLKQVLELRKGTEVIIEMNALDDVDIVELDNETMQDTRSRLNKRMHAMIGDIAGAQCKPTAHIKQELKKLLVDKQLLKESTSELDVRGLAIAIYLLQNEFHT